MAENYGISQETIAKSEFIKDAKLLHEKAFTILSGEAAVSTVGGCVLYEQFTGGAFSGKYKVYAVPVQKTKENATTTPAINGVLTHFQVAVGTAGSIEPGSVTVYYTVGAAEKTVSGDDGEGHIFDVDATVEIDYLNGTMHLFCITGPPDNATTVQITYKSYAAGGHDPKIILCSTKDASAADVKTIGYDGGVFRAAKLTPDLSTNTYAIKRLAKNNIIVDTIG